MANTVDVSKATLQVIVGPESNQIHVSKATLQVIVGPESEPTEPPARITQMPIGVIADAYNAEGNASEMTQMPVHVIANADDADGNAVHMTQMSILLLSLPIKAAMMTQMPLQAVMPLDPTDVLPMIPQWPIVETWASATTIVESHYGYEQRMGLRSQPRILVTYQIPLTSQEQRSQAFYTLYRYGASVLEYPLYQYLMQLGQPADIGDDTLYVDHRATNLREGEAAYLFSPDGTQWVRVEIDTIVASPLSVVLVEPLGQEIGGDWWLVPTPRMRLKDGGTTSMDSADNGMLAVDMTVVEPRDLLRPTQSTTSLLTYMDGIPVLPDAWVADGAVAEQFGRGREDMSAVSNEYFFPGWLHPKRVTPRRFFVQKEDLDYWRAFAAEINGRRGTFLMPSLRNDLWLASTPALGATVLVVENNEVALYLASQSNRWLRILRTNGTVIYRRVIQTILGMDGLVRLTLNANIGAGAGSNQFRTISLMSRCRLESDEIVLEHHINHCEISFGVRTVEA